MQEQWLPVVGYEGFYEVSNIGNVKSVDRIAIKKCGMVLRLKGKKLNTAKHNQGYYKARLYKNGINELLFVHRIVAKSFIKNIQNLPIVNHIDGDKSNNKISNLEWVTSQQNINHAINTGLHKAQIGTSHGMSKLNDEIVRLIRLDALKNITHVDIAKKYGVGRECITKIINHKTWKHVI